MNNNFLNLGGNPQNLSKNPQVNDINRGMDIPFLSLGKSEQPVPEDVAEYFPNKKFDSNLDIYITSSDLPDISKERAYRQPWYEQAGAFANQAVVGEIIGGTLMSVGALADPITDLIIVTGKQIGRAHV